MPQNRAFTADGTDQSPEPGEKVEAPQPDYSVGYRRPPKGGRFVRGQSGNPRGRPKGRVSMPAVVNKLANRKVRINDGSGSKWVTVLEALLAVQSARALKGDTKSTAILLDLINQLGEPEEDNNATPLESEDQATLQRALARLETKRKPSDDNGGG